MPAMSARRGGNSSRDRGLSLSPDIGVLVEELIRDKRPGPCIGTIKLKDVSTGLFGELDADSGDRFTLIIPFAGICLEWDVIFFGNDSLYAPDFYFGEDGFAPDIAALPSLAEWDPLNPRALCKVIGELLREYSLFQVDLLNTSEAVAMEYATLLERGQLSTNWIEVAFVQKKSADAYNFLMRLPVSFDEIPACLLEPGETTVNSQASLLVSYNANLVPLTIHLFVDPHIERVLGAESVKLPSGYADVYLVEYMLHVCDMLQERVKVVSNSWLRRREYFSSFLSIFGKSILEYDTEWYKTISVLLEQDDFSFVLSVNLANNHPETKPTFVFQSIYHEQCGKPYTETCKDYQYSPNWKSNEMVIRAKPVIQEKAKSFRDKSIYMPNL